MPFTDSRPPVGVSSPATQRRKVVLPQPEGPMKLTNSPLPMARSTPCSAVTGPSAVWNVRSSASALMTAAAGSGTLAARGVALMSDCRKLRPGGTYEGKQGFSYFEGIAAETVGSGTICMHLLTVPPGGRAKAHKHATHETAIYVLEGRARMYWGERLEHVMETEAGEMIFIPADMPHLPFNPYDAPAIAVIARTDPHEQESVVLMPELEALVPA